MLTATLMGTPALVTPHPASAQSPQVELTPAFDNDLPKAQVTTASLVICTI
ncbi:MAG: hypothetical protein M3252_02805 [Actinomycetota bacterium]|nr:hypothetical protein [Actinomycetota bacterium]